MVGLSFFAELAEQGACRRTAARRREWLPSSLSVDGRRRTATMLAVSLIPTSIPVAENTTAVLGVLLTRFLSLVS